jgi:predicted dehydrogenase
LNALIVGCGSIGYRHLGHLRALGIEHLAACDQDAGRLGLAVEAFRVAAYPDFERALSDFKPEIVFVCTPAFQHVQMGILALQAGADVFIEKPLGLTKEGVSDLMALAERGSRIVQVGYNMRFHPALRHIKERVTEGLIGEIVTARFQFGLYLPKWWATRDYRQTYIVREAIGGGLLFDLSHEIDTARWLIGEVSSVGAFGVSHKQLEMDSPDVLHLILKFDGLAVAHIEIDAWRPAYVRTCNLVGTRGELFWDCPDGRIDTSLGRLNLRTHEAPEWQPVEVPGAPDSVYKNELRAFLNCVTTRTQPLVNLAEAVRTLDVLLAAKSSLGRGSMEHISG